MIKEMNRAFKYIMMSGICLSVAACQKDFIDLEPNAQFTDAVYFSKSADFKAYSAGF
jgi:starch-binding outer membrane protein, SusD/RagB family